MTDSFNVTPDWLEQRLDKPGVSIIDGSWYLPVQGRDARAEYLAGHIPSAIFFDHDVVVDPDSTLPHTLPSPGLFARFAGSMGISDRDLIVVYDGPGLFTAPRVWWMFRAMGAKDVFVLDGGFDRWKEAGRPMTSAPTKIAPSLFNVSFDAARVATLDDMQGIVTGGTAVIVDARPPARFSGEEPEPRPGMKSGHMPGSANLPFMSLARDGVLLSAEELRQVFSDAGIDLAKPIVTSCGSGVTAAVLSMALETIGHPDHKLYDGSWTEWGGRTDTAVEKT